MRGTQQTKSVAVMGYRLYEVEVLYKLTKQNKNKLKIGSNRIGVGDNIRNLWS